MAVKMEREERQRYTASYSISCSNTAKATHPEYNVEDEERELDTGIAGECSLTAPGSDTSATAVAKASTSSQTHRCRSRQQIWLSHVHGIHRRNDSMSSNYWKWSLDILIFCNMKNNQVEYVTTMSNVLAFLAPRGSQIVPSLSAIGNYNSKRYCNQSYFHN